MEIAERGEMGLHLADYHLEASRLAIAEAKEEAKAEEKEEKLKQAREHLETAAEMIEKMGYHRRDGEVEELRKVLAES